MLVQSILLLVAEELPSHTLLGLGVGRREGCLKIYFSICSQNWNEMTELVSSNGNYCNYRKAFADCDGFKIPILGVHLKDLIAVHVIFPDWTEENKVNIVKMHQLSVTLSELVSLQNASHHLEPNLDLINLLTVSSTGWSLCSNRLELEPHLPGDAERFPPAVHNEGRGGVGCRVSGWKEISKEEGWVSHTCNLRKFKLLNMISKQRKFRLL